MASLDVPTFFEIVYVRQPQEPVVNRRVAMVTTATVPSIWTMAKHTAKGSLRAVNAMPHQTHAVTPRAVMETTAGARSIQVLAWHPARTSLLGESDPKHHSSCRLVRSTTPGVSQFLLAIFLNKSWFTVFADRILQVVDVSQHPTHAASRSHAI